MFKKCILIDMERLRHPNSGLANVFRNIAGGLEELQTKFEFSYYGSPKTLGSRILSSKIIAYKRWHKCFETFSKHYDLIHVSYQNSPFFRKKYKHTKKILTLHDLNFLHEHLPAQKRRCLYRKVNATLRHVDYIVCISRFVKEDFLRNKHLFDLKNLKEIFVVHNGVVLPQHKDYNLGRFEYLKGKKYILNIGVLFEKKNQKTLVKMLPHIDEDLVLVFSSAKKDYALELKAEIASSGCAHRVHFLHNVSEEEKYALIQNCTALCHPSLVEGFGIPPIEAMAFGKPVFLSRFTSLPEIGGDVAFYFDDFDPHCMAQTYKAGMQTYSEDSEGYKERTKEWAKQFDYKIMADNYLKIYEQILS